MSLPYLVLAEFSKHHACSHTVWVDPQPVLHPITGQIELGEPQRESSFAELRAGKYICRHCGAIGYANRAYALEDHAAMTDEPEAYVRRLLEEYRHLALEEGRCAALGQEALALSALRRGIRKKLELQETFQALATRARDTQDARA